MILCHFFLFDPIIQSSPIHYIVPFTASFIGRSLIVGVASLSDMGSSICLYLLRATRDRLSLCPESLLAYIAFEGTGVTAFISLGLSRLRRTDEESPEIPRFPVTLREAHGLATHQLQSAGDAPRKTSYQVSRVPRILWRFPIAFPCRSS